MRFYVKTGSEDTLRTINKATRKALSQSLVAFPSQFEIFHYFPGAGSRWTSVVCETRWPPLTLFELIALHCCQHRPGQFLRFFGLQPQLAYFSHFISTINSQPKNFPIPHHQAVITAFAARILRFHANLRHQRCLQPKLQIAFPFMLIADSNFQRADNRTSKIPTRP